VFQDARCGFSHAVPGWPRALFGHAQRETADAVLELHELPIWLRYRLDRQSFAASSAADLAMRYAERFATHTSGAVVTPTPAPDYALASWGVDAAATATYDRAPDGFGADAEHLTVLVRQSAIMVVVRRYRRDVDWVRLAIVASAVDASFLWHPRAFREPRRIWPDGTFLEPMAYPALKPPRQEAIVSVARALSLSAAEKGALSNELHAIVTRDDPPWRPIPPAERAALLERLASAATSWSLRAILEGHLRDVVTAHDLRGFALMIGLAMRSRRE
jgi:hypothetical protein